MPGDTWIDAEEQFLKLSEEYVFICKMKIIQLGNSCTKEIYKKKPTKETTSNLEKEIPVVPHWSVGLNDKKNNVTYIYIAVKWCITLYAYGWFFDSYKTQTDLYI